jgi:N-acetyl-alpha-D-muramate 1-phosphate uridylyltransferase
MKAMVFAAGIGSRLKEFTKDTPKCLIEVGGIPMLERVVEQLKGAGVNSLVINVHHHADKVIQFVESRNNFGVNVTFSREPSLLDTGGGLKNVARHFNGEEAFLIHNADIFSDIDLKGLVSSHRARNAIGTLAVMERPSQRGLHFSADNRLVGWTGENAVAPEGTRVLAFCGISVASARIFEFMGDEAVFSIIKSYLTAARATGAVWGEVVSNCEWTDIGTPEQLQGLRERLTAGRSR